MLTRPQPPWTPFHDAPTRPVRMPLAERTRWLWLVPLAGGFLAVLGWVLTHDPGPGLSDRAWVTLALTAALVVLLATHRRAGPLLRTVRLRRVVAEYALVAVLAGLLATSGTSRAPHAKAAPAPTATTAARPSATTAPKEAAAAPTRCPDPSLAHAPSWLSCVWHRAMDPPPSPTPSATTRRNR
jgi:hypothetical protein